MMKPIKTSAREALCTPEGGLRAPVCFERVWRRAFVAAGSAMLSAALLLAGCSKEPAGGTEGERTAITVSATLPVGAAEASTKAVADGSTALTLSFARADETSAGSYGAYGAEFTGTRAAGTGSRSLTFDPPQFYSLKRLNTRIIGWYPGGATEAGSGVGYYDASAGTVGWVIDGQQDILSASAQEGSSISAMPGFVFNHRLAQIQFWPYAESAAAAAQWGPVKSITLLDQPEQYTLTLPQDGGTDAVFSATGNAEFTVRNLPSGNLSTTAARQGDPVMIAPTTENTTLSLIIGMTDGSFFNVTVPERTYPAGSVTAVKLKFTTMRVQVEPAITISAWTPAGELNAYPKIVNGNTIILSDGIGLAVGDYPMHEPWLVTPAHTENAWNANTSGKNTFGKCFQVARDNAVGKDGSSVKMTWYEASGKYNSSYNRDTYSACGSYSELSDKSDLGTWRLPTAREQNLIATLWRELVNCNLTSTRVAVHTATRKLTTPLTTWAGWSPTSTDMTGLTAGSDLGLARCVRDL